MLRKITVITDSHGEVIGTQLGQGEPDPGTGVSTSLVAGPDQHVHRIEYDVPRLGSRTGIDDFHRKLTEHLRRAQS
jgi:hypothetical protein